jgi:hypothetical protein
MKLTAYARKELKNFHTKYNTEVNHLMGFLVQIDNMAEFLFNKNLSINNDIS